MPLSMCVEVSDWVQMSPADQCMQICVFQTHVTVQQQIVLGLMYSALPLRHNTCTAKMSNTESLQNLLYIVGQAWQFSTPDSFRPPKRFIPPIHVAFHIISK